MMEEKIIQKIVNQAQELYNSTRQAKELNLKVYIDLHTNDNYTSEKPEVFISRIVYPQD
ncbi:hypothetical protein VT569_05260 [Flavobacterium psychrophilum]|uniref:hypothetical protein n=1 Tax=Flavobacterium psychrophilum TaxID=96345 RepID=UPI003B42ED0F